MIRSTELPDDARIWLAREGGFVAAPGLSRPREIALVDCRDDQRLAIRRVLDACRLQAVPAAGAADQRFFRIVISRDSEPDTPLDELLIDETHAPTDLVSLWQNGPE
ncbi:protealysin inhibitor emfourin [Salinisphaera sp. SPP-AMP-43]|uniref:protealysin inhibitor emfourin n=1 Tax=Salinisphaera sp. SPP-AMP-43 TaxID=3121288 RepID=UPI003C6E8140